MKNTLVVVFTFGIALSGLICFTACSPPGARACFEGERLSRQGKYAQAIEKLKVATALFPRDPRVWNLLGLAYHHGGQAGKAIDAYQSALGLDSRFAPARFNLGCLYLDQNRLPAAVSELDLYTQLKPDEGIGWMRLAAANLRSRRFDDAGGCYLNALRIDPNSARALNDLGVVLVQRRRPREALEYFAASLKRNSSFAPALLNSAIVTHRYFDDDPGALEKYREFLGSDSDPARVAAVKQLVARLEVALNPPAPREDPNLSMVEPSVPESRDSMTNAPVKEIKSPAEAEAPSLASTNKTEPEVAQALPKAETNGVLVAVANHTDSEDNRISATPKAEKEPAPTPVATPIETEEENDSPVRDAPAHEVEQERVTEAERPQVARDVSGQLPTESERGQPSAEPNPEISSREPATEKTPLIMPVQPRENRWRIAERLNPIKWFQTKNDSKSEEGAEFAPEPVETDSAANAEIRPSDKLEDDGSSAVPAPAPPVVRAPSYRYRFPPVPEAGDRSKAERSFAQGINAHRELRLTQAIESYREAIREDPGFFEAHFNLGLAALELNSLAESLASYETALSINPFSAEARYNFALALQRAGYLHDAVRELERILLDNGNFTKAHFSLAKLYADRLFETESARRHYLRVLELEPGHPQAVAIRYWLSEHP